MFSTLSSTIIHAPRGRGLCKCSSVCAQYYFVSQAQKRDLLNGTVLRAWLISGASCGVRQRLLLSSPASPPAQWGADSASLPRGPACSRGERQETQGEGCSLRPWSRYAQSPRFVGPISHRKENVRPAVCLSSVWAAGTGAEGTAPGGRGWAQP